MGLDEFCLGGFFGLLGFFFFWVGSYSSSGREWWFLWKWESRKVMDGLEDTYEDLEEMITTISVFGRGKHHSFRIAHGVYG